MVVIWSDRDSTIKETWRKDVEEEEEAGRWNQIEGDAPCFSRFRACPCTSFNIHVLDQIIPFS
jgi:hypothetical protein